MTQCIGSINRQISQDEQKLYDHLLYWVELESPEELIKRFYVLFINGIGYSDPEVVSALDRVITSRTAGQEFRYVLNRCCHILINRWQARCQSQLMIPRLIGLFEAVPHAPLSNIARSRSVRRLRELVHLFRETEQYLTLRRLAQVLTQAAEVQANSGQRPLGSLIRRYPYLYEHCLLSEDSTQEQQHTIRKIQGELQRQFEIDLSQYMTYQVRRSQVDSHSATGEPRLVYPVQNPTLLGDQDLDQAIRHYVGRVEGGSTYRDLAFSFLAHSSYAPSYRAFKDDLYEYITASVDSEYGKRQFNQQLHNQLKSILPDSEAQPLNDFLLVRTCSQLLNFLVVDSPQHPEHFIFIDLINNLGPVLTTGLLLKIVLLCRRVKPTLERRFSILFNHYEAYQREAVQWFINALENLNVALSTHFGGLDLSFIC